MRNTTILLAAAPLALLAACGDAETDDATNADATTVASSESDPTASDAAGTPGPAMKLDEAGDFSGNYTYTADDGSQRGVTIDTESKTYKYFGPDGLQRTGDYTWTPDGFRIMIPEWDEGPTWFAIREGQLVRLNEDKEFNSETMVEGERYSRDDDNAMFSREPELGSTVAPQN